MIPRFLEHTIRRALKTFPVVLVTGPRQSGKTTLLKNVWGRSFRYVSLENPDVRMSAKNDPNMFLRMNEPPLILDEIQYLPELLSYIKTSVDENRAPGRFIITGSQSFPLMRDVSQSLAGRVAVLNLLPLSLGELMLGKAVSVERFLNFGWLKKRVGK
ncbi:MAG: AAA family ATPase, partial [Deltaproteobacteria bacterium]|nr:AAA family ATPase [Deltaproteobacteria bacterium]